MFKSLLALLLASIVVKEAFSFAIGEQGVFLGKEEASPEAKLYQIKSKFHSFEETQRMATIMKKFQENLLNLDEKDFPSQMFNENSLKRNSLKSLCVKSFTETVINSDSTDSEISAILEVLDYFNTIYTTRVNFNGVDIDAIMDTGSTDITVNSNLCETEGCLTSKKVIAVTPEDGELSDFSEQIMALDEEWDITYASGYILCRLGVGKVSIGDVEVPDQEMCLIEYEEDILSSVRLFPFDLCKETEIDLPKCVWSFHLVQRRWRL
jgi:hypothetical protein